jgi:hypothetical protein
MPLTEGPAERLKPRITNIAQVSSPRNKAHSPQQQIVDCMDAAPERVFDGHYGAFCDALSQGKDCCLKLLTREGFPIRARLESRPLAIRPRRTLVGDRSLVSLRKRDLSKSVLLCHTRWAQAALRWVHRVITHYRCQFAYLRALMLTITGP